MKEYFLNLEKTYKWAVKEIKESEQLKFFSIGCKDAGNYDYLLLVGSEDGLKVFHIDYYKLTELAYDSVAIDNWFQEMDENFYDDYEDLFEAKWIDEEHFLLHIRNYIRNM